MLVAGMESAGNRRVQTITLPTGTGKTLLAATWSLSLRQRIAREEGQPPLILIVLPYLAIIDQTAREYDMLFGERLAPGELISYHSLSDCTYAPDLEDESQNFFLNTWQSDVVITTFDQFLFALLSPKARHQMRFHHLADALIVLDEVQALPCVLWDPLRTALAVVTKMGTSRVLAMSATQPGFLTDPCELIESPAAFFEQMKRYRIVLRHRKPMHLGEFIDACKRQFPDWEGQRILITLNTRRSARRVRDALAKVMADGMALEFLSADVTPKDRLAAIRRIKQNEPCLVVSTQCVEAGVDIDMDFVIRDFAPLDSIIQIAGRCNRNGRSDRGVVEIFSLEDDDCGRPFAGMIYDKILLEETREVLGEQATIDEEAVFPLTKSYFAALAREKDTGEAETRRWARWEEMTAVRRLLRGAPRPQVEFVVTEKDPSLRSDLEAARQTPDRWDRRRALRRLAHRIAENTVNVYKTAELNPHDYADPFPPAATPGEEWFWLLRPGRYTAERGLDLDGREGDQETWGLIV
jgi:CRISPR-associated endonuclease/helicase Cas3